MSTMPCPTHLTVVTLSRAILRGRVHLTIDTLGHLLAFHVTPANEQDRNYEQLSLGLAVKCSCPELPDSGEGSRVVLPDFIFRNSLTPGDCFRS